MTDLTIVANPIRLSEGLLLAALPLLGYTYAFAFEFGYISHYDLPYWMIRLSLLHVIIVMGVVALVLMFLISTSLMLPRGPWIGVIGILGNLWMPVLVIQLG